MVLKMCWLEKEHCKSELELRGTRSSDVKCRAEGVVGDEIKIGKLCCGGWFERSSIASG